MDGKDPKDLINQAEEQKYSVANDSLEVFSWFSNNSGEMFLASKVVEAISEDFGWDSHRVRKAITGLVDDTLDPVQQVVVNGNTHIGIIEYKEFQDFGGYGFIEYDDTLGQRKNLVCAKCVSEKEYASEPFRAVEGYGRHPSGCSYNHLLEHLEQHYDESHSEKPSDIEVGASLVSGTTISSNTAIHGGNQSSFGVDSFGVGNLADGNILKNSGGSLTGVQDLIVKQSTEPSNTNVLWIDDSETWPLAKIYDNNLGGWRMISEQTAIPDDLVDNFEDGDITITNSNWTGWSGDTSALTAQQSTVLSGNFSGKIQNSATSEIQATRNTPIWSTEVSFLVRANQLPGNSNNGIEIVVRNGSDDILRTRFDYSGVVRSYTNSGHGEASWVADTTYKIRYYNWDFTAETFSIEIIRQSDGTTILQNNGVAFDLSGSNIDSVAVRNKDSNSTGVSVFFDDVIVI